MAENQTQEASSPLSRQILALVKVVGDLAGVGDESIATYAAAHLRYEGVNGLTEEAEAKLDAADFELIGVSGTAEERIVLASNLLQGLIVPARIAGPKRLRLRWALEAAQFELADLVRELRFGVEDWRDML